MLCFYDVDPAYADYLRQYDSRVPNITYGVHNKFTCGIVLSIDGYSYFAPISSNKRRQQTNMLIRDRDGRVLASLKFGFMFPAPRANVALKDFMMVRATDPAYADLLEKEYTFCRAREQDIYLKARRIYEIGKNPDHVLNRYCCDFHLLEAKHDEWVKSGNADH